MAVSGQTKNHKIGIYCFSAKLTTLTSKNKEWLCSVYRCYNPANHWIFNMSNTIGATSGTIIASPSGAYEFTPVVSEVLVNLSCIVLCRQLFVFLSFFFWPLHCLSNTTLHCPIQHYTVQYNITLSNTTLHCPIQELVVESICIIINTCLLPDVVNRQ